MLDRPWICSLVAAVSIVVAAPSAISGGDHHMTVLPDTSTNRHISRVAHGSAHGSAHDDSRDGGNAPTTRVVEIVGVDYAFKSPTTLPAGRTMFRFRNAGKVPHELNISLLRKGATVEQFVNSVNAGTPSATYREAPVGVLLAAPGRIGGANLVTDLLPGRTYVLICMDQNTPKSKPHFTMGMYSRLDVTARPSPSVPLANVDTIVGTEYAFQYPRTLAPGRHRIAFVNAGTVRHEVVMLLLKPGITLQHLIDVQKAGGNVDPLIEDAIGVLHSPAGTSPLGLLDIDMRPGRDYTIICTLTSDDKSPPHLMLGMQGSIHVTDARTRSGG